MKSKKYHTQGFQYFSNLPVLHYLQAVLFMNMLYNISIFFKSTSTSLFTGGTFHEYVIQYFNIFQIYQYFTIYRRYFLAHLAFRPCELLSSLFVCRLSVNISHFNLLLRNHWTNCNQTLVEWSLDGPLSKMCPVIPTSNQDGHQAKNRKKGGMKF